MADDIDCLHLAYFTRGLPLLGGYGSMFYWRPLSRQIYFKLLAPLMLPHPALIAALHFALLAFACVILYRALRARLGCAYAALAAGFVPLMESARISIAWPSNFQDLGPMFFAALAIHEAAAARLATTLVAVLASLLCKEVGAVAVLLLPWLHPGDRRDRVRWLLAIAGVVTAWGVTYAFVHHHAGLILPRPGDDPSGVPSWPGRYLWALGNAARTAMSLPVAGSALDWMAGGSLLLILLAAVVVATTAPGRARLARALPWVGWGAAWFAAGTLPIAAAYPYWLPCRVALPGIGAGVALAALAGAAHPALAIALLVSRLTLFAFSPAPPHEISVQPEERGAWLDFQKLTRLQILVRQTRDVLQRRYPRLPHGARIGQLNLPWAAQYAFGASNALQVWYRDSTLRWEPFEELEQRPDHGFTAFVQYQESGRRQAAVVEAEAMSSLQRAYLALDAGDFHGAFSEVNRADSLQLDREARAFLGNLAGMRAICLTTMGAPEEAEREARRALNLWPGSPNALMALAQIWSDRGDVDRATAALEEVLRSYPNQEFARFMLDQLRAGRTGAPPPANR